MGQTKTAATVAAELLCAMKIFAEHYSNEFVSRDEASDDLDGLHTLVMNSLEQQLIETVLKKCQGNKLRAAKVLGLHRNTLTSKIVGFRRESQPVETKPAPVNSALRARAKAKRRHQPQKATQASL